MSKKCVGWMCWNKPTYRVRVSFNTWENSRKRSYDICNKCYNEMNPEHKHIIIEKPNDSKMEKYLDYEGKRYITESYKIDTMISTYRKLIK